MISRNIQSVAISPVILMLRGALGGIPKREDVGLLIHDIVSTSVPIKNEENKYFLKQMAFNFSKFEIVMNIYYVKLSRDR